MKILIACDMPGISSVTSWEQCTPGNPSYEKACHHMTDEVNLIVNELFSCGIDVVYVTDGYKDGRNLDLDLLDKRAQVFCGTNLPWGAMSGIEMGVDGVIFSGYHAKAGPEKALLAHTWNNQIMDARINGETMGEIGINAALAGFFKTPILMITGDQQAIAEAEDILPDIESTVLKESMSYSSGKCYPLAVVKDLLYDSTHKIAENLKNGTIPNTYQTQVPLDLEVVFTNPYYAELANLLPSVNRIAGRTVACQCKDAGEAYTTFRAICGVTDRMIE